MEAGKAMICVWPMESLVSALFSEKPSTILKTRRPEMAHSLFLLES